MRMYDLILKKKEGGELLPEEIRFFIQGYTAGEIPDYQAAALAMAICFRGMTEEETACLTMAMARSGDLVDLSGIPGVKVDKHSTGGVGDKTTLIAAPVAAACGVPVAKMSGRGLGHTGGTVDKLEAIPGLKTEMGRQEFLEQVRRIGLCVAGQSGNLAPADKKLYALRDVTATVDSMPLIAASIMSKKIAAGSDAIVLDVKTGSGAFMKTQADALALAREMVSIGEKVGRRVMAVITDMDTPLGCCIGNSLEVMEAAKVLRGKGPEDLTEVSLELASHMLRLAGMGGPEECRRRAREAVESGGALEKLRQMVRAQGGDALALDDFSRFPQAGLCQEVLARESGYVTGVDALACGRASVLLGAGRLKKGDPIDHAAGIVMLKKRGDRVEKGEALAKIYSSEEGKLAEGQQVYLKAVSIGNQPPQARALIRARVSRDGVELCGEPSGR
ncbi:MAG: pyrimidine-nucleoside phosphorylase [Oscillospiraceae bacterium]|nr:pyrimidine-nucleoside phosphorylase [Oscillospiraceae bacterium]